MSYCRFSSDNFRCDLYCYESCYGGYVTHVAGRKPVDDVPVVPAFGSVPDDQWLCAHRMQMAFLETCECAPLGLPHDGETFHDEDLPSFLARLENLKSLGYRVPDFVFELVREEMTDADNEADNSNQ